LAQYKLNEMDGQSQAQVIGAMEAHMKKNLAQWMLLAAVVAAMSGCQNVNTNSMAGLSAEQQKQKLYEQIEAKYEVPKAHYQLGQIYRNEGNYDRAAYHFTTSAEFLPMNWPAQAASVRAYQDGNRPDKAGIVSTQWVQRTTKAEEAISLGKAFENEKMNTYALRAYERAAALAPRSPVVYKQLGNYYLRRNDKIHAEEQFRKSFEMDPYQADVSAELGKMGVIVQAPRKTNPGFFDWLFGNSQSAAPDNTKAAPQSSPTTPPSPAAPEK
jgi:tetratricopeptide (TPR) repeat protein